MKQPQLSPALLEKYILMLAVNPANGLQYAILQKQTRFDSVAAIYQAAMECTNAGVEAIRLQEYTQAWHYGKLADAFFRMFELLTTKNKF